ncbi:MAG: glutamate formimidoyltransferase [Anaerolineae bacterium]|nr:glutamate formimidoyltransferase [Anaerolineae bacterium]
MPGSLIECIPNFSEARRPEIIDEIVNTIKSVSGTAVLDKHSDLDHNRTVITFVGDSAAVEEAAFQAIKKASSLIDLNFHRGEHPRIGATDVVPFVPISGASMLDCVEISKRLGQRVSAELNIPVYLYEEAASTPERQNLENIRRGQYEGLKKDILTDPARKPDFGPAELGSAGATVIGARHPLIAFNVYLTSDDVKIAQKIAKSMRHSSGGFRFVKAMGIIVDGRAQVSMNLTNYRQTPIARVVEAIRREAERYGVGIHHSELVGMIPQEALVDASTWYLQLDAFDPEQILENKLAEVSAKAQMELSEGEFINKLAEGTPTPGGGSAAAHTGAAAAALVSMVCRLTIGKKKYAEVEAELSSLLVQSEALRKALSRLVSQDADAFERFMSAMKLPKETPEQIAARDAAIEKAAIYAAEVPLSVGQKAVQVYQAALVVVEKGNINAISDAASAAALSRAALSGAGLNVRINLAPYPENVEGQRILKNLSQLEDELVSLENLLKEKIKTRSNLPVF